MICSASWFHQGKIYTNKMYQCGRLPPHPTPQPTTSASSVSLAFGGKRQEK